MDKINKEKVGEFIKSLRSEKGYTQKELAEKLFISDKAISKWERGISLPDIDMLLPLSKVFNVSVTSILLGQRIDEQESLKVKDIENILSYSISEKSNSIISNSNDRKKALKYGLIFILISILESLFFMREGIYSYDNLVHASSIYIIAGIILLSLVFSNDRLPSYYDENKISFYSNGFFRINLMGVRFNNSNWKYIIKTLRISLYTLLFIAPILYGPVLNYFQGEKILIFYLFLELAIIFIPVYYVAKKYE